MSNYRSLYLATLAVAALIFSFGIQHYDLWPADEPRYGEVAREMLESGDYLVPRVNGETYLEKPPLLFWSIALMGKLTGQVDALAARLPSVVSAVGVVALTGSLARAMYGPRAALWAMLILMSTLRFWWQARTAQIDMLLTLFMVIALYALWRWEEERSWKWWSVLTAAVGAGMLAKGPPALVFPLLFILTFYWGRPLPRKQLHWVSAGLLACAMMALWYLPARMAGAENTAAALESGVFENIFRNTIGRMFLGVSKAQAPWYYLTTIPVDCLPWTLLFPWLLPWLWRARNQNQAGAFLWCWIVPALIFFSLSIGKRALYLMPLFPAFAIAMAACLEVQVKQWQQADKALPRMLLWLGAGLVVIGSAPIIAAFTPYAHALPPGIYLFTAAIWILGAAAIALRTRITAEQLPLAMGLITVLAYSAAIWWVFPVINTFKSAAGICTPIRELAASNADFRLYSVGFSREEYVFYSERFHEPVFTGLVGTPPADWDSLIEKAELQRHTRKVIAEAVEDIPINNLGAMTPSELNTLRNVVESAVQADEDAMGVIAFEHELIAELDGFLQRFAADPPAFMFVQEEDWRWMAALSSTPSRFRLLREQQVGRRKVLLFANAAGSRMTP